jgi:murein DD-endopeptidase MepM/ murein hydrolase activator NlpD
MTGTQRHRHVATSLVLLGCLVALLSTPSAASNATPAPEPLPPYQVRMGHQFRLALPAAALPLTGYRLTGRFGDSSGLWSSVHQGLDFAAAYGTPIRSVVAGVVVATGYDGALGNKTVVRLADGTEVWYCHQSDQVAQVGDRVRAGDLLGYVGTTGNTTGPHLHLEWHPAGGNAVDPYSALARLGLHP